MWKMLLHLQVKSKPNDDDDENQSQSRSARSLEVMHVMKLWPLVMKEYHLYMILRYNCVSYFIYRDPLTMYIRQSQEV